MIEYNLKMKIHGIVCITEIMQTAGGFIPEPTF
jgi:hypothetical protein